MSTTKNAAHREPMTESQTLREDLDHTRQHLADTVQEISRRLNVPNRMKETAASAGHRVSDAAGQTGQMMKQVPDAVKGLPATGKRHPKVTAAVGGAVVLGAGAMAWMARRHK
ncbi:DUF3618 domain-containing protein [Kribbella sp. NPDC003557]|jgi:hypothetical protein|uniref:DUF3618 domain-containing protein n=1 Tax=Kribbella sp. NPDC003557 TaxID=3154449 RepID=UPI0033A17B9C